MNTKRRSHLFAWRLGTLSLLICGSQMSQASEMPGGQILFNPFPDCTYLQISLSARKLNFYDRDRPVKTYPVAIGRTGWETPVGNFQVLDMQRNPVWKHPLTGRIVRAGVPENPMGLHWIQFATAGENQVGLHGTPHPWTIGKAASHGCVRMYPKDIEALYSRICVGTPVIIVR